MKKDFISLTTEYTKNIGDEIQIIAAERFIKGRTTGETVDRERLSAYEGKPAKVIMNGWYFHDPNYWPPSSRLTPLITSFHLTDLDGENGTVDGVYGHSTNLDKNPRDVVLEKDKVGFLLKNGPIGARDLEVYQFMQKNNIPSYFSGCLTLTLQPKGLKKNGTIFCVDTPEEVVDYIKSKTDKKVILAKNSELPRDISYEEKMKLAQDRLDDYERADLVISRRLHSALPSLALNTPAILLHNKSVDASRYLGLKDLLRNCTQEEFLNGMYNEQLNSPEPNREYYKTIRHNLETIVTGFVEGKPHSDEAYIRISDKNLQTVLRAKEENEHHVHGFVDKLLATAPAPIQQPTLLHRIKNKTKALLK